MSSEGDIVGRPRKGEALEKVAEVAAGALAPAVQTPDEQARHVQSRVVLSGKAEQVIWLKMCAWPAPRIAQATGLSTDSVQRYLHSPHFLALFESRKQEFLGRVFEAMQERLLEVGLEGLATRLEIMRNEKANKWLRDKIAKDLVDLAMEVGKARGPVGEVGEKLLMAVERIRKRKLASGDTLIEKVTVSGTPGQAGAELVAQMDASAQAAVSEDTDVKPTSD